MAVFLFVGSNWVFCLLFLDGKFSNNDGVPFVGGGSSEII